MATLTDITFVFVAGVNNSGRPQLVEPNVIREAIPGLRFGQSYGSGHFSMLEVPEPIDAMIERFMSIELSEA